MANRKIYLTREQIKKLIEYGDEQKLENVDNERFLKRMIKETNEHELKENLILERGGVAAFPYAGTLQNICQYVKQYIRSNDPINNQWEIVIPKKITAAIDFFEELDLVIIVDIIPDNNFSSGGGGAVVKKNPQQQLSNNNKFLTGKIIIYAESDKDGYLCERTLYNSLVHELNHKYEELKSSSSKNPNRIHNDNKNLRAGASAQIFTQNQEINQLLKTIFYRLFSSSEVNALIAGTYGDLMGMHSQRKKFLNDRIHLQSYCIYYEIASKLHLLNKLSDEEWMNIKNFLDGKKKITKKGHGLQSFKNKFYRMVNVYLKKLYDGIIRVACTYYDRAEEYNQIQEFKNSPEYILLVDEKMYIYPDDIIRLEEKK